MEKVIFRTSNLRRNRNKTEDPSVPDAWLGYRKENSKDGTLKNLDLEGLRSQRASTTIPNDPTTIKMVSNEGLECFSMILTKKVFSEMINKASRALNT